MSDNNRSYASPVTTAPKNSSSLTHLLRRLEAATSRLEDIASSAFEPSSSAHGSISAATPVAGTKATSSAPDLPTISQTDSSSTVKPVAEPLPPPITDMDAIMENEVKAFVGASKGLDPLVEEQATAVAKGFADQRRFLMVTTKAKRPDPQSQTFMDLLKDLQQDLGTAGDIKDSNRGSPMKEHLAMVAEGISTLQWLVMDGKPADVVAEMIGGAQMYGNRVLKTYKEGFVYDQRTRSHSFQLTIFAAINRTLSSFDHITHFSNHCRPTSRNTSPLELHGTPLVSMQLRRCGKSMKHLVRTESQRPRHQQQGDHRLRLHLHFQTLTTSLHHLQRLLVVLPRQLPAIWAPCSSNLTGANLSRQVLRKSTKVR